MDNLEPGRTAEKTLTVTADQTARHLGSGSIEVFATPAMIALMESAAVAAIDPLLPEGQASVGIALDVRHLAPTPLGVKVRARAEVTAVDGSRITLTVRAWDETEVIGEGTHSRAIVDLARFAARAAKKRGSGIV